MLTNVTYRLTAFLRLSNQHITLSCHHDTWLATPLLRVLKNHNARCWTTLPQCGNFYNHYKANINKKPLQKKIIIFPTARAVDLEVVGGLPVDRDRLVGHHCSKISINTKLPYRYF